MKKFVLAFVRRGLVACGFGPMILAILYLILQRHGVVQTLTVNEVSLGIFSLSMLAFVAGGMNAIYQVERLPLMVAILIHGGCLYISYLATYLLNGWLEWGSTPILVFSAIFVAGYFAIWAIIYVIIKKRTEKLNQAFRQSHQHPRA